MSPYTVVTRLIGDAAGWVAIVSDAQDQRGIGHSTTERNAIGVAWRSYWNCCKTKDEE